MKKSKLLNIIKWLVASIIVTLGIVNGFLNLWGVDVKNDPVKRKKYSKIWHFFMATIKAQIAIVILLILIYQGFEWKSAIFWALLWFNLSGAVYDFIINCIRKYYENVASIWRVDDGSINGWIKGLIGVVGIWILRGILIIINILIY